MDAIGVGVVSIGGFLLYASIKGLHPWNLFTQSLGGPAASNTSAIGNAPYTGGFGAPATVQGQQVTLPQGTSVAGGGTGALHG